MKDKSFFRRYVDYLKDNPRGYWFRSRPFGWGWVPATWQGFSMIFIFLGYAIFLVTGLSTPEPTILELKSFFVKFIVAIGALIVIAALTGEKPSWRWGFK